jgi:multidrug efflux system membrane fusion protein
VPVTVTAAVRRDVPTLLRNIGAVQAFQSVLMRARVDGTLEKVFFEEGQEVKRGDPIAQIDPRPYQAAYDAAMARKAQDQVNLDNAIRDLQRYSTLAQQEAASRQKLDTQAAMVAALQASMRGDDAAIAAAKVNLDYTNITAPFTGRVGLRQVDPGNVIRAADASGVGIVTIAQIQPISVTFTLPQDTLPSIQAAMAQNKLPVLAYSADDKTMLSRGDLLTTDNGIDPATGTIKLKAVFANTDNKLWPGQFVNVKLQIGVLAGALTVPSTAVQRGADRLYVFVIKPDSTAAVQTVQVIQDDGKIAVISSGIDEGAKIVIAGQSRLIAGTKVTATDAKPNS